MGKKIIIILFIVLFGNFIIGCELKQSNSDGLGGHSIIP